MKASSEYKSLARENLKNNWGSAILVCLITALIGIVLGIIPFVGPIVSALLSGQLIVAELIYFIKLNSKSSPKVREMFDGFSKNWLNNFITHLVYSIYIVLWTLLFIIPGIIKAYSYSMTMFLKAKNPELKTKEAITMSRKIMDGKKWKLFCLEFSFIGWALLSIITLGIGFLFLAPYVQASVTAFYEDAYAQYQPEN